MSLSTHNMRLEDAKDKIQNYINNKNSLKAEVNHEAEEWGTFYIDVKRHAGNGIPTRDIIRETGLVPSSVTDSNFSATDEYTQRVWLTTLSDVATFRGEAE